MLKSILLALSLLTPPTYSGDGVGKALPPPRTRAGDSAGNGGHGYEGHLQRIAQFRVLGALSDAKNKQVLTPEEIEVVTNSIKAGLPIVMVIPEKLEPGQFLDLGGEEAKVESDAKGRVHLLERGKKVGSRLVQVKQTRKINIQWDLTALKAATKDGKEVPDDLVRDVASMAINYSYAAGNLDRGEDAGEISKKLFIPKADPSQLLPSSAHRYDTVRRLNELAARGERLIKKLQDARTQSVRGQELVEDQTRQVARLRRTANYQFKPMDESWANNLDLAERNLMLIEAEAAELSVK